jgi:uncharacterized protein YkwD
MLLGLIFSLAVVLSDGTPTEDASPPPAKTAQSALAVEPSNVDPVAERELLALVNRARARAELPPLQLDPNLTQAARDHAVVMAAHQQLSHQFSGEPDLARRIGTVALHLDEAAENVATADSPDRAHEGLMNSPPHRENLLHPAYNIVGFGVVRRGSALYVVEDFGHSLPIYSAQQAAEMAAKSVSGARAEVRLPGLQRRDGSSLQNDACAGVRNGSIVRTSATPPPQSHYIFRYTVMQPESLPSIAGPAIGDSAIRAFAVGACFARSDRYPDGVYSMMLVFY